MGFDPKTVNEIVLSHGHFDHTSGLFDMIRLAPEARIWAGLGVGEERRCDADARRLGGGGALFEHLEFNSVNPYKEIAPGVTAFVVPKEERDECFIGHKGMWCVDEHGDIIPDTFADDLSILVKGEKGYSVLLGCAHTGLPNILRYIRKTFGVDSFDTILGGTHLCIMEPEHYDTWMGALTEFKVKHWRPNHCTGFRAAAELARRFDNVDWAGAGSRHEL